MEIVILDKTNVEKYDQCLLKNKKHPGYQAKVNWLNKRFKEGLKIKRAVDENGQAVSFIEYVPIENAWRAVDGKNYFFIHCVYTSPKKFQEQNYMSLLLNDCINEAKKENKNGVAVITADGSFMADKRIFEKNGFELVDEKRGGYQLLAHSFDKTNLPKFKEYEKSLSQYKGLHLFYTDQCPALAKPVGEIQTTCKEKGIEIKIHYIQSSSDAQNAPFISGTFGIIYNSKVMAERCISNTRFLNILKKLNLI